MNSYYFHAAPQEPIAVVIPACNEEERIGTVLDVLQDVTPVTQIIVVDDGSTDGTAEAVRNRYKSDRRIELVSLRTNRGKGGALLAGAEASNHDIIVFLDADLISLRPEHVEALIEPVQNGASNMALGIFKGGRYRTDLSHQFAPFLSGQRCLRWSLFCDTPDVGAARWGVESALSLHAWRNRYRVLKVPWRGVTHATRPEKMRTPSSYWSHVVMWLDIAAYVIKHLPRNPRRRVMPEGQHLPSGIKSSLGKLFFFR